MWAPHPERKRWAHPSVRAGRYNSTASLQGGARGLRWGAVAAVLQPHPPWPCTRSTVRLVPLPAHGPHLSVTGSTLAYVSATTPTRVGRCCLVFTRLPPPLVFTRLVFTRVVFAFAFLVFVSASASASCEEAKRRAHDASASASASREARTHLAAGVRILLLLLPPLEASEVMDSVSLSLLNSISNFRVLSSSKASKTELVKKYCQTIDGILDHLEMALNRAFPQIIPDDELSKVLEELGATINEATELVGGWNQMMSKIYFVIQVDSIIAKMQIYVFELCQIVNSLMQIESMHLEDLEHDSCEKNSDVIREASRALAGEVMPNSEELGKIQTTLSLSTNQELLMEYVALVKVKTKGNHEDNKELDDINDIVELVNHMLDRHVEEKQTRSIDGVPIPADFCCPLSLELMSDPVIVASGQTYEHVFIRKWFDLGYNICPKTRQILGHTKLIPNFTVKQLIENWCEVHGIMLPDPIKLLSSCFPASLNITDGSTGANKSGSPEHGQLVASLHPKAQCVSDDSHHDNLIHENSNSDDRLSSFGDTDDSEPDSLRLSTETTAANKSLLDEKTDRCEGLKQLTEDGFQVSDEEQHLERNGRSHISNHHQLDVDNVRVQASTDINASEVMQDGLVTTCSKVPDIPPRLGGVRSRNQPICWRQSDKTIPRIGLSSSTDSKPDFSGNDAKVRNLIEELKSDSAEVQRSATGELRILSRHSLENRIAIANCRAIPFLVSLLHSTDPSTQENAVTILLNLSLDDNNKIAIASAEAIEPLIFVLQVGNPEAKANSAATLFSLSVIEENKIKIGRSGAIEPLVFLLGEGTPQGKKDAATALFNLSIFHEHKTRIVQAGAVKHLVELMDPAAGMVDKAVAVLANLATVQEGRNAIAQAGGIRVLVEVVELGSARSKENAAAALLQLCTNSNRFCTLVLQEGVVPPLVALSQSGTARAREKAQVLLSYFRNQRHVNVGRGVKNGAQHV
uniref:RING-type E3 ubiquitin transferase n=2 Tax=Oryza punctata TaxID=4537 RepID=A0A0E0JRW0_ORYPU